MVDLTIKTCEKNEVISHYKVTLRCIQTHKGKREIMRRVICPFWDKLFVQRRKDINRDMYISTQFFKTSNRSFSIIKMQLGAFSLYQNKLHLKFTIINCTYIHMSLLIPFRLCTFELPILHLKISTLRSFTIINATWCV
jgi:hypothetical protein